MDIIFTDSTGLYFYSALLQANAAIIALIGLYTTFRIQVAQSNIDSIKNYFLAGNSNIRDYAIQFEDKSLEEKDKYLRNNSIAATEKSQLTKWYQNLIEIKNLKEKIKLPSILLGLAIGINACLLFLSSTFNQYNKNIEIFLASICLLYQIVLVFVITRRAIQLVQE